MLLKKELYFLSNLIIVALCCLWFYNVSYRLSLGIVLFSLFILTGDYKAKIIKIYKDKIAFSFFLLFFIFIIGLIWTDDYEHIDIILLLKKC